MTQLHAREKPAPKRDRHGNIILEAPLREAPLVEEKPEVTKSPGGKTFRRQKPQADISETMTPADAILRSSAVNPDLDRALRLAKGIS